MPSIKRRIRALELVPADEGKHIVLQEGLALITSVNYSPSEVFASLQFTLGLDPNEEITVIENT